MWTEITRPKYEREEQRYASDLTDAEWAVIGIQTIVVGCSTSRHSPP
jgi:hypothetical protein